MRLKSVKIYSKLWLLSSQCNTETQYLPLGEAKFTKLLEELKKAKRYIFLECFIIEGLMWNSILEILVEKLVRVDVRVIYDDAGCLLLYLTDMIKSLKNGNKVLHFNPWYPYYLLA